MAPVRENPSHSLPPALKSAAEAHRQGRNAEACEIAAAWLKRSPDDYVAMTILAAAAIDLNRPVEAEDILRHALDLAPAYLQAAMQLARSLAAQARLVEAIATAEDVLRRHPGNLQAGTYLAQLYAEAGQLDHAAATYRQLVSANSDDANLWAGYAQMLRYAGSKNESEDAYRRALARDAANSTAWWGLSNLDPETIDEEGQRRLEALVEAPPAAADQVQLHFALGNLLDRAGRPSEAFEHYRKANQLRRSAAPYDADRLSREVDQSIALLSDGIVDERKACGCAVSGPVFIVGMPRSGSTVLERMLARHPNIEAMGELPVLSRMVNVLSGRLAGRGSYPAGLRQLSCEQIGALGETYLRRVTELRKTSRPLFTDKLHMNWWHLPLIRMILPAAKVIDIRRDALDCCWSNYKLHFPIGHLASNDLADLGRFYADYVRLADFARSIAPENIARVCYEQLVEDPAAELARILDFLGLEFDERCLDFHLAEGPVFTASSEQVRQPLNRAGIGGSALYRKWLGPLIDALGPLAKEPG